METIFRQEGMYDSADGVSLVINRKKYSTDQADLLWRVKFNDEYVRRGVALFRKLNGEYFSYQTHWFKDYYYYYYQASKAVVKPLTVDEAKDLTEKYAAEEYISVFGDVEE